MILPLHQATTAHPHKASKNIGTILLKRVVTHEHSTIPGRVVADVYKVQRCARLCMVH